MLVRHGVPCLLCAPGEPFEKKLLVPRVAIENLRLSGMICALVSEGIQCNHFGWVGAENPTNVCEQRQALLDALPASQQRQALQKRWKMEVTCCEPCAEPACKKQNTNVGSRCESQASDVPCQTACAETHKGVGAMETQPARKRRLEGDAEATQAVLENVARALHSPVCVPHEQAEQAVERLEGLDGDALRKFCASIGIVLTKKNHKRSTMRKTLTTLLSEASQKIRNAVATQNDCYKNQTPKHKACAVSPDTCTGGKQMSQPNAVASSTGVRRQSQPESSGLLDRAVKAVCAQDGFASEDVLQYLDQIEKLEGQKLQQFCTSVGIVLTKKHENGHRVRKSRNALLAEARDKVRSFCSQGAATEEHAALRAEGQTCDAANVSPLAMLQEKFSEAFSCIKSAAAVPVSVGRRILELIQPMHQHLCRSEIGGLCAIVGVSQTQKNPNGNTVRKGLRTQLQEVEAKVRDAIQLPGLQTCLEKGKLTSYFKTSSVKAQQLDAKPPKSHREEIVGAYRWVLANADALVAAGVPEAKKELLQSRLYAAMSSKFTQWRNHRHKRFRAWRESSSMPLVVRTPSEQVQTPGAWVATGAFDGSRAVARSSRAQQSCFGGERLRSQLLAQVSGRTGASLQGQQHHRSCALSQCRKLGFVSRLLRQIALVELVDHQYDLLPFNNGELVAAVMSHRQAADRREARLQDILQAYFSHPRTGFLHLQWAKLCGQGAVMSVEDTIQCVLASLARFEHCFNVDCALLQPRQIASVALCAHHFLNSKKDLALSHWYSRIIQLPLYVSAEHVQSEAQLAWEKLPQHVQEHTDACLASRQSQALVSPPVVCQLCHLGFRSVETLHRHACEKHGGWSEYRKRLFYLAKENGLKEMQPWVKRNILQSFSFFQQHSVPGKPNDWTEDTYTKAVPRREVACAVCAVKDWLEHRFSCYLFQEAEAADFNGRLSKYNGNFCFGPAQKIDEILSVEAYAALMPSIPLEELHASSVQLPKFPFRWLLHTRRVPLLKAASQVPSDVPHLCAGVGDPEQTVWL